MLNSDPDSSIHVICPANQTDVWDHIVAALEGDHRFRVVKGPARLSQACAMARNVARSVLIVSRASLMQGLNAQIRWLCASGQLHILTFAGINDECESADQYLRAGWAGVLRYDDCPEVYRKAVKATADGELWLPRRVLSQLVRDGLKPREDTRVNLTPRESEILKLVGSGLKNRDIATHLWISNETVRWHLRSVYSKLDVTDRQSARELAQLLPR